jgi:hypothetical protein
VRARADESRTHRSLLSNLPLVLKTRTPTGVHPLSSTPAAAPINDCKRRPLHMPVHENLSAAIPACHASRSEASKLLPDQNTAKPPNTSSNSSIRRGMPSSPSPATPHDGGAIIWPGRKSGSQEAGGHSLPVYGEGWGGAGRGAAQLTHTSTVAVSQDAGECLPSPSPARGGKKGGCSGIHQPATSATLQQLSSPRAQILSRRLGREGGILMALVRSRQASSSLSHVKRSKA